MSDVDCTIDYYKILGIERRAPVLAIKKAYRILALKYHPDKGKCELVRGQGETDEDYYKRCDKFFEEKFIGVNNANEVLTDKDKRRDYDIACKAAEAEKAAKEAEKAAKEAAQAAQAAQVAQVAQATQVAQASASDSAYYGDGEGLYRRHQRRATEDMDYRRQKKKEAAAAAAAKIKTAEAEKVALIKQFGDDLDEGFNSLQGDVANVKEILQKYIDLMKENFKKKYYFTEGWTHPIAQPWTLNLRIIKECMEHSVSGEVGRNIAAGAMNWGIPYGLRSHNPPPNPSLKESWSSGIRKIMASDTELRAVIQQITKIENNGLYEKFPETVDNSQMSEPRRGPENNILSLVLSFIIAEYMFHACCVGDLDFITFLSKLPLKSKNLEMMLGGFNRSYHIGTGESDTPPRTLSFLTPLLAAIKYKHIDIIKVLTGNNINVIKVNFKKVCVVWWMKQPCNHWYNPLAYALWVWADKRAVLRTGYRNTTKLLGYKLVSRERTEEERVILTHLISCDIVQRRLRRGGQVGGADQTADINDEYIYEQVLSTEWLPTGVLNEEYRPLPLNHRRLGYTPLFYAIYMGIVDVVRYIISEERNDATGADGVMKDILQGLAAAKMAAWIAAKKAEHEAQDDPFDEEAAKTEYEAVLAEEKNAAARTALEASDILEIKSNPVLPEVSILPFDRSNHRGVIDRSGEKKRRANWILSETITPLEYAFRLRATEFDTKQTGSCVNSWTMMQNETLSDNLTKIIVTLINEGADVNVPFISAPFKGWYPLDIAEQQQKLRQEEVEEKKKQQEEDLSKLTVRGLKEKLLENDEELHLGLGAGLPWPDAPDLIKRLNEIFAAAVAGSVVVREHWTSIVELLRAKSAKKYMNPVDRLGNWFMDRLENAGGSLSFKNQLKHNNRKLTNRKLTNRKLNNRKLTNRKYNKRKYNTRKLVNRKLTNRKYNKRKYKKITHRNKKKII